MVAAVTLFNWLLKERIELVNIALVYQLPVVLSAFWWGRWPAYFSAVCSVLLFDFLFVPPIFTFTVDDIRYIWSFLTFLIVAFVTGGRTELLRYEAAAARLREKSTRALYDFSREIAAVIDLDTIVRKLAGQAAAALGRKVLVLLPDESGSLTVWAEHDHLFGGKETGNANKFPLADSAEAAVAAWAFEHRQVAGRSTETPHEYDILKELAQNAGKVLTHKQLLKMIWGNLHNEDTHYIRVYIGQLRRKIEENPAQPRYIISEPGVGYRLMDK